MKLAHFSTRVGEMLVGNDVGTQVGTVDGILVGSHGATNVDGASHFAETYEIGTIA
jgi:hypothetical protein